MPNPIRTLKRTDRLSQKQIAMIKSLKARGIKEFQVYRRKGNKTRLSVHSAYVDVIRKAQAQKLGNVKRYPHAYDTQAQRKFHVMPKSVGKRFKSGTKVRNKTFLAKFLKP